MTDRSAQSSRILAYLVFGTGLLAMSTASVLIRLAQAPPLTIGAWRLGLASFFLTPFALRAARREWPRLHRKELLSLILSGIALSAHFAAWIYALSLTTVASAVVLVSTNPVFVGLVAHFWLHEHVRKRTVLGIVLAVSGSAIIGYGDLGISGRALLGDLLALLGALAGSAYMLLGRTVRRRLSTIAYVWPCYGIAACFLLLYCGLTRQPLTGYTPVTYGIFILLAIGPQILGHSAFNWALGRFSPIFVTVVLLGEPIGASFLAWLILHEVPPLTVFIGAPLILLGIYLASSQEADLPTQP